MQNTKQNEKYFSGRTVLVTGASGFIGIPLIVSLGRVGAYVHAVSRSEVGDRGGNIRWWKGDLKDLDVTGKILRQVKPSLVIHLAGYAWGNQDLLSVPATFYGCLATTVNVLTAAAESGCQRIVLPGSLEEPVDSDEIPNSPYSAAKWACSVYGSMFRKVFTMDVVQTRIFMTYGPGQNYRKVIPHIILSLLQGHSPVLQSQERLVDWIYIDDVVEGIMASSRLDGHKTIDIGSGIALSIGSVAEKLRRLINISRPIRFSAKPKRSNEVVRVADIEATHRRTGWRPMIPLDIGLLKTIEWYKERCDAMHGDVGVGSNTAFTFKTDRNEEEGADS
jgi:nucleoside-diphosphate-sugar epimerase